MQVIGTLRSLAQLSNGSGYVDTATFETMTWEAGSQPPRGRLLRSAGEVPAESKHDMLTSKARWGARWRRWVIEAIHRARVSRAQEQRAQGLASRVTRTDLDH